MRKLSRILAVAMLIMAVIIIPLGVSTVIMAFELGLIFDAVSCILMLCFYIAFSLYELREFIAEHEWYLAEAPVERMYGDVETDTSDELPF